MSKRPSKPPSNRQLRVAHELRNAVARFLVSGEYHHPVLESVMVTVTSVKVSADLKIASVFIFLPVSVEIKPVLAALKEMSHEIKKYIAENVALRFVPDLRFFFDDTEEQVLKIESIFSKLHKD